jgi:hypothetical protein
VVKCSIYLEPETKRYTNEKATALKWPTKFYQTVSEQNLQSKPIKHVVYKSHMYAVKQFQFYKLYMTNFRHFTVSEYLQTLPCEIWGSHTNEYEDSVFWDTTPQSG